MPNDKFTEIFRPVLEAAAADHWLGIVFDPTNGAERHTLYSDASVADLVPVLRAVLARLEAGELRMPVYGGVRWSDEESGK